MNYVKVPYISNAKLLWSNDYAAADTDYTLSESLENFTTIVIVYRTNIEHDYKYVFVEDLKKYYGGTHSIVDSVVCLEPNSTAFGLRGTCWVKFRNDTTFFMGLGYNNSNWVLRACAIYGL